MSGSLATYIAVSQGLLAGVGVGWFLAGFAQPYRLRFGVLAMTLFVGAAMVVPLIVVQA